MSGPVALVVGPQNDLGGRPCRVCGRGLEDGEEAHVFVLPGRTRSTVHHAGPCHRTDRSFYSIECGLGETS